MKYPDRMARLALQVLALTLGWVLLSAPGCESSLDRSEVGSACTRARDCEPNLDCIAGECRWPADAQTDAAASDADATEASVRDASADATLD